MFALECASLLTCRLNLTYESLGESDSYAIATALGGTKDQHRCPDTARGDEPAAVDELLEKARERRRDPFFGAWAIAREEARQTNADKGLWLVQHSRCALPRGAVEKLLGFDRSATLSLIGSSAVVGALQEQKGHGLSDNHLHSGAADELGGLIERLVCRVPSDAEPRKLESAYGPTKHSGELNLGPPLLGLAAACIRLDGPEKPRPGQEALIEDEAWWRAATTASRAADAIDVSDFGALRAPIQGLVSQSGRAPQVRLLFETLGRIAVGAPVAAAKVRAARRGLISLGVLCDLIAIPRGSNLGLFVRRFDLMRTMRGLFGKDPERLRSALGSMYVHNGVTHIELRKSIVPKSGHTVSVPAIVSDIRDDIEEHARGAIEACVAVERADLTVRMPLTFTRHASKPVDLAAQPSGYVPFSVPLGETMAVADAIVQATAAEPNSRFVGAVDVVGDEKRVPNWVYALAFRRIAATEGSELEFACHAGEYFGDRLEGLRRIAEVALFRPAVVRRIGHCLALGSEQGVESRAVGHAANDLLENALWATLILEGNPQAGLDAAAVAGPKPLLSELKQTAQRIASYVFGLDVSIGDVRRWYLARFDTEAVARWVPELRSTSAMTAEAWPRGTSNPLPKPSHVADAMLAAAIYDTTFVVELPGGQRRISYNPKVMLPEKLIEEARVQLVDAEDHARGTVRRWLANEEIVIESCPSSNTALARTPIGRHPIWQFHKDQLRCSVNTDDPALFGASLSEEYVHAGMVAEGDGGDSALFVAELAETSRTVGMIRRSLCDAASKPLETYHSLLAREAPPDASYTLDE